MDPPYRDKNYAGSDDDEGKNPKERTCYGKLG